MRRLPVMVEHHGCDDRRAKVSAQRQRRPSAGLSFDDSLRATRRGCILCNVVHPIVPTSDFQFHSTASITQCSVGVLVMFLNLYLGCHRASIAMVFCVGRSLANPPIMNTTQGPRPALVPIHHAGQVLSKARSEDTAEARRKTREGAKTSARKNTGSKATHATTRGTRTDAAPKEIKRVSEIEQCL
eukprot:scaffold177066_cov32-Tisochrysis_lutea.AAC.4